MARSRKVEHVVVLKSKFKHEEQAVWFGRARLLQDRIVLKGIGYKESIPLDDIVELRWIDDRLTIVTDGGEEFPLIIRSAAIWKYEIQARTDLSDNTTGARLPGDVREDQSGKSPRGDTVESGKDGEPRKDQASRKAGDAPPSVHVNQQYSLPYDESSSGDGSETKA